MSTGHPQALLCPKLCSVLSCCPKSIPETPEAGSSVSLGGVKDPWGDQWKEQDFSCPSSHIPSRALILYFTSLFVHSNSPQLCPSHHGFQIKIPALSSQFCRAVLGTGSCRLLEGSLGCCFPLLISANISCRPPAPPVPCPATPSLSLDISLCTDSSALPAVLQPHELPLG